MKNKFNVALFLAILFGLAVAVPSYAKNDDRKELRQELREYAKNRIEEAVELRKQLKEEFKERDGDCEHCSEVMKNWRGRFASTTATTTPWFWKYKYADEISDKKVKICHVPLGNPGNGHTIEISKNALSAHLAHGDFVGECGEYQDDDDDDNDIPTSDISAPVITNLSVHLSNATATISWSTNENADSRLWYSTSTPVNVTSGQTFFRSSASLTANHSFVITNLLSTTTYHFLISSADGSGNRSTSTERSFSTADFIAPVISGISATHSTSTLATTTVISWLTNEAADSRLWFGTTTPLNLLASTTMSTSSPLYITSHQFVLSGLDPGTPYYYIISSIDIFGNQSTSTEQSFTTWP